MFFKSKHSPIFLEGKYSKGYKTYRKAYNDGYYYIVNDTVDYMSYKYGFYDTIVLESNIQYASSLIQHYGSNSEYLKLIYEEDIKSKVHNYFICKDLIQNLYDKNLTKTIQDKHLELKGYFDRYNKHFNYTKQYNNAEILINNYIKL